MDRKIIEVINKQVLKDANSWWMYQVVSSQVIKEMYLKFVKSPFSYKIGED